MSRLFRWSCCAGAVLLVQWSCLTAPADAQRYPYTTRHGGILKSATNAAFDAPEPVVSSMPQRTVAKASPSAKVIPAEWRVEEPQPASFEEGPEYADYGGGYHDYGANGNCGTCCDGCGGCGDNCGGCGSGCGDGCCGCGDPCGGYGSCGSCCDSGCGGCGPHYMLFTDYLYLQVTDADVAHAQQQNGIGGAGTTPFGEIGTVELEYNSGVRAGGIVACDECSSVYFSFTHFESDAFASLEAPNIVGGGGAIGSLVHHPQAQITASNGPVDADYEVNYQLTDLLFRRKFRGDCNYEAHYLIGVQYGHLEQDFGQTGVFAGGNAGTIDTFSAIDFDGGGLKIGFDSERRFGSCFSGYARFTAAAMSGRFTSSYTMYNSTTETLLAQADWKDDRVISHVEYELGLALTSCNQRWRWATGYMFSHWANIVNTPVFIDAVQADNYVEVDGSISFDGLVTRLEARW